MTTETPLTCSLLNDNAKRFARIPSLCLDSCLDRSGLTEIDAVLFLPVCLCNLWLLLLLVPGFLYFWGVVFVLSTTAVAFLKSEVVVDTSPRPRRSSPDDAEADKQSSYDYSPDGELRVPLVTTSGDGESCPAALEVEVNGLANGAVVSPLAQRRASVDLSAESSDNSNNHASMLNESRLSLPADAAEKKRRGRGTSDAEGGKKKEDQGERHLSLSQTYSVMLGVLRLRPILKYILFVFLVKVSPCNGLCVYVCVSVCLSVNSPC
ncbi:unnamed protein product [Dibothriocephalus latus]|uniref:Uncharacterized protein n=1 Tax=Dibothriocephalus latus TaxID=60516 RepID=A0A3P7R4U8_DIBLA|nr:unnamed protein product [Dibothriocephalus latus]